MTKPNSSDPLKDEPTGRFRTITNWKDDEDPPQEPALRSVLEDRLPHTIKPASPPPEPPRQPPPAARPSPAQAPPETGSGRKSRKERLTSAFWTVTSTMSLTVDAILIAVVIILLFYVRQLNFELNELKSLSSMPLETVRGLYKNFEKMESARIVTEVQLNTEIPVQFDLQINTQTEVVLSQNTPISGARVTLSTGGLEISNAPADIILPAGTRLPITLVLTVPVSKNVPVSLLVPVNIELAKTDLNAPFVGLQDVLEPLYCLLDPKAVASDGILICEKAKTP